MGVSLVRSKALVFEIRITGSNTIPLVIYGVVSVMVALNSVKVIERDRYSYGTPICQVSSAIEHSTDNRKVSGLIPLPGTILALVTELVYVYDLGS